MPGRFVFFECEEKRYSIPFQSKYSLEHRPLCLYEFNIIIVLSGALRGMCDDWYRYIEEFESFVKGIGQKNILLPRRKQRSQSKIFIKSKMRLVDRVSFEGDFN